ARNDYPYYLGMDYAVRYRAERVLAGVKNLTKATAADMGRVHADRVSIPSAVFALGFDGDMQPDSTGAALYSATRETLAAMLCERDPMKRVVPIMYTDDPLPTPVIYRTRVALPRLIEQNDRTMLNGDEWSELIEQAHQRTQATIGQNTTWGDLHKTRTRH